MEILMTVFTTTSSIWNTRVFPSLSAPWLLWWYIICIINLFVFTRWGICCIADLFRNNRLQVIMAIVSWMDQVKRAPPILLHHHVIQLQNQLQSRKRLKIIPTTIFTFFVTVSITIISMFICLLFIYFFSDCAYLKSKVCTLVPMSVLLSGCACNLTCIVTLHSDTIICNQQRL